MNYEDKVLASSESELWKSRYQLKTMLREEIGSSTMDLVDDLLTVERELVRREKFSLRSWFSRLKTTLENY